MPSALASPGGPVRATASRWPENAPTTAEKGTRLRTGRPNPKSASDGPRFQSAAPALAPAHARGGIVPPLVRIRIVPFTRHKACSAFAAVELGTCTSMFSKTYEISAPRPVSWSNRPIANSGHVLVSSGFCSMLPWMPSARYRHNHSFRAPITHKRFSPSRYNILSARVAKSADATDLKSVIRKRVCGFKSRPGHQNSSSIFNQLERCHSVWG
jgi:hypothetical protein